MTEILKAETPVYGGYVISRAGGVVFIKGAIPGETVQVETIEKRKDYSIARAVNILEPSGFREEPRCVYYGACGGCHLQHISYQEQVSMKAGILRETLNRLAGPAVVGEKGPELFLPPIFGQQFAYRRRAQFKVADGKVGFFREASTGLVEIERCPIMADPVNEKLQVLKNLSLRGLREVHITVDELGQECVALLKGVPFDGALADEFLRSSAFSGVAFEDGSYSGRGHLCFRDLPGLVYTVSPWSFFQSNRALNRLAMDEVQCALSPLEGRKILDIYAGGGNFSLPLAGGASRILAVEGNRHSARDGLRNVEANGIKNVRFIAKPVEKTLRGFEAEDSFDSVIMDPPRPGLTEEAMSRLVALRPGKIIYISCNPATLARDLKKLSASYRLDSVRPADFFPNTYHIESISVLSRR